MRRESHRYRGVRRSSRGAGWGHRAVYVASAIAAASLITGFGLAGYWFGTFSHTFSQASVSGFETAPYGVVFLTAGAQYASMIPNLNFTANNTTGTVGPCQNLSSDGPGTNELNQSGATNYTVLSAANSTNSRNTTETIICLDAVNDGAVSYLWGAHTNQTSWDSIGSAANNTTAPLFNESLENLTGNASGAGSVLTIPGCDPVVGNGTNATAAYTKLANCAFFAGNNQTTFYPHAGFYNSTGVWINEANASSPDPAYWAPGQTGYAPSDLVFYAAIGFVNAVPNTTYEAEVSFAGATPIPQVFWLNTGAGGNETVIFVFDMTIAWLTGLTGADYGFANATGPFYSSIIASINTFSVTVSQCGIDAQSMVACPDSLGGATMP